VKPAPGWGVHPGRTDQRAQLSDVAPTLCTLEGIEALPTRTGADLAPVMRGEAAGEPARTLYFDELPVLHSLLAGPVKLIVYEEDEGRLGRHLYHLGEDPGEQHDLAGERPERADALEEALRRFYAPFERAGLHRIDGGGRFAVMDEATVDRLMALGYL